MNFSHLPKVELHLHLDCSLSYDIVKELKPGTTYEAFRQSFIAPPKCIDLADYIKRAINGFELMQSREQLQLVTMDLFRQLKADNVVYAELRFAPLQHIMQGLTAHEVVSTVNDTVVKCIEETGIEASIILCTLRHYAESQSMQTAYLVKDFEGSKVTAFDIAADEAGFPIDSHIAAFQFVRENKIFCTAHAGEARGPQSVWETMENFRPTRIGHGIRSIEDGGLINFLRENDIHLEVCPTSNVQTNVVDRMDDHPAAKIFDQGISMSINTDARTISDVTLGSEYEVMKTIFNWKQSHFLRCNLEAMRHAFTTEDIRRKISHKILNGYIG
ncbi:adenosine deaminase [Pollutibacter soli]|uniref:adenosine deaminase n=1 Tax=Pollutibacter soli TaxID=3034157 RepID=UPI003013DA9A